MDKNETEIRVLNPLFQSTQKLHQHAIKARDLDFEVCPKNHAVQLVKEWHSRLPNCQDGPWTHAFRGHHNDRTYVVALWNSPSARCLPADWRELRRLACSPDAPRNTPSRFLAYMAKWFKINTKCTHLISYQDTEVHTGTIYKAAGWIPEYQSKPRHRDRSKNRTGTNRAYRSNINGDSTDAASKIRWGKTLNP